MEFSASSRPCGVFFFASVKLGSWTIDLKGLFQFKALSYFDSGHGIITAFFWFLFLVFLLTLIVIDKACYIY